MFKGLKPILAIAIVVAALAASIAVPVAGSMCEESQVVGFFFGDLIEGS